MMTFPNILSFFSLPTSSPLSTTLSTLLLVIPTSLVLGLYFYQTALIYPAHFPPGSREIVDSPSLFNFEKWEEVKLDTRDGEVLRCYIMYYVEGKNEDIRKQRPTLLYLHANAGNMGHRLPIARMLQNMLKCNVVMLSYRGYGLSTGRPNESGLRIDSQTCLDFVISHPILQHTRIIVFGQSIGGAVAIDLVARNADKVKALMLENTFLSIPLLIPHLLPLISPLRFLCHQIWPSHKTVKSIPETIPMLFLSSKKDELVPRSHMEKLWTTVGGAEITGNDEGEESTAGADIEDEVNGVKLKYQVAGRERNRMFVSLENGTHNNACLQTGYFESVGVFWNRFIEKK